MESRTHARPFFSNRNDEVINWKEAQEILKSHQDSHDNCSSIPAMKPKGGEVKTAAKPVSGFPVKILQFKVGHCKAETKQSGVAS